jgi:hypothetical protein
MNVRSAIPLNTHTYTTTGAFKEAVEKSQDEGAEEGELLEEVAAQRLQVSVGRVYGIIV